MITTCSIRRVGLCSFSKLTLLMYIFNLPFQITFPSYMLKSLSNLYFRGVFSTCISSYLFKLQFRFYLFTITFEIAFWMYPFIFKATFVNHLFNYIVGYLSSCRYKLHCKLPHLSWLVSYLFNSHLEVTFYNYMF